MNLNYRIDLKKMEEEFANLDLLFTELMNTPDSEQLEEFNNAFYGALAKVEELCKKYNYNIKEAVGYYKMKAFLDMAKSEETVTISRSEYDALQQAAFRLAGLEH